MKVLIKGLDQTGAPVEEILELAEYGRGTSKNAYAKYTVQLLPETFFRDKYTPKPRDVVASALTPRTTPNYPTIQGRVQPGRILPAGVGVYKVLEPLEELKALAEKNGWVYEEQGDELLGKATIRSKRDGKEALSVTWRDSWTRTIGADFNRRTDARSHCKKTLQWPAPEAFKPASRGVTQSAQMQCRRSVHHGFHPVDEKCPWCP